MLGVGLNDHPYPNRLYADGRVPTISGSRNTGMNMGARICKINMFLPYFVANTLCCSFSSAFQDFSAFRTKRFETQRKGVTKRFGRNLRFLALAPVLEALSAGAVAWHH